MRYGVRRLAALGLVGLCAAVTACGGTPTTATPPASPSSAAPSQPAPSGSGAAGSTSGPSAPTVPGYTFEIAPPDALAAFEQLAKTSPDAFSGVSAYAVKDADDQEIGALILFGVETAGTDPKALADVLAQSIAKGLAGSGEVSTETVSGTKVVWTEAPPDSASAIWYQDGVLYMNIGSSKAQLAPFVNSAIKTG